MGQDTSKCLKDKNKVDVIENKTVKQDSSNIKHIDSFNEENLHNPNSLIDIDDLEERIKQLQNSYDFTYMNFPFLCDMRSVKYIHGSKILFLMKGLPGSGKSTVAKCLNKLYALSDGESCIYSADNYWIQEDGSYQFDASKLSEAHNTCKAGVIEAVLAQKPVVIVDNTNLRYWEMKFYIDAARRFNYIVVVVEPQTPWRKSAQQLAQKNSHDISLSIINSKIEIFEEVRPVYYAWFLNDIDSILLQNITQSWLERMCQIDDFMKCFKKVRIKTKEDLMQYYSYGPNNICKTRNLHCTSKYTARWESDAEDYHNNSDVIMALGKTFVLKVVGFVITSRCVCARVSLDEDQQPLWGAEDAVGKSCGNSTPKKKNNFKGPKSAEIVMPANKIKPKDISSIATLRIISKNAISSQKSHITLGTASGTPPATAGEDVLQVVEYERTISGKRYNIPGAKVEHFGNNVWAVYPYKMAIFDSLFSYWL